jgi:glycosyltransferase involved in cell wall biosynthesis
MSSNKIRLLHLIKSLNIGGIEKSTILYSNHLCKIIDFVGIYASKGFYDYSGCVNSTINRIVPPHPIWLKRYFIQNLFNLFAIIKHNHISHLHYHHRVFTPFVFFVKLFFPMIKIIYTHHSVFKDRINNLLIGGKIIALNETTKYDLPLHLQKKSIIISHGVHVNQTTNKFTTSPKNIGYVGRFVKQKGIMNLIDSFKIINDEIVDTKLIFIGEGILKNEMIKRIEHLKLQSKVIFKSPSFSEKEIYSNIDILVLPSEKLEGFGLVVLEAFANGIPVIVRDLQIYNNFVINNHNGSIVKGNLSEPILKMLIFNDYYNELSKNAFESAQKYDIQKIISQYVILYKNNG